MYFFSRAISLTPRDIKQVTEVEELILLFCNQKLDLLKLIFLPKTLKVARLIIADRISLNCINTKLFAANS